MVCHVGIYRREITWNGRKIRAGGIGGVATRAGSQRHGYASIALNAAIQTLKDEGATDFALLFCEPHNAPFYVGRGWKPFDGEIYAEQPERARSLRGDGALRLRPQARSAARRHRPVRAALVTCTHAGRLRKSGSIWLLHKL